VFNFLFGAFDLHERLTALWQALLTSRGMTILCENADDVVLAVRINKTELRRNMTFMAALAVIGD
jgi:hypothetical protein